MNVRDKNNMILSYSQVNSLFYIRFNNEVIHTQKKKPNQTELIEALQSDNWGCRFDDMRAGKKVRISTRIYNEMLGAVPPLKFTLEGFYCGEPYSGDLHYYFFREDGRLYGQLKSIK